MQETSQEKVIVGMSGGVDSSVAAYLLKQQGYQVEGLFMKNWDEDDGTEYCTAITDLADAQAVCDRLDIELHTANFAAEYWDNVFDHFLQEYRAGRTPNPDVLCNREIKFKAFLEYALALGADKIATGHYVRKGSANVAVDAGALNAEIASNPKPTTTNLLKGLDGNKDQSYFLCEVSEACLEKSLFPVGELDKAEVRRIASSLNLITHNKKDSTGICFIGERKFKDFLEQYIPAQPGKITTVEGEEIGDHSGLMYYTYGQRQGLGIGGQQNRSEDPWYVVGKDMEDNILLVAQGQNHPSLYSQALLASVPNWINSDRELTAGSPLSCQAKIRYRQQDQQCEIELLENDKVKVQFSEPQRAVTPGQYIVFYEGEICLGGAIIEEYLQ